MLKYMNTEIQLFKKNIQKSHKNIINKKEPDKHVKKCCCIYI